ncbi:MAG TPA: nuclear transport factor 2 family protein [Mycobacteriales bacterium]|nr:nuclear transport factor 2 family protein [Mycobacteriales bacterium]
MTDLEDRQAIRDLVHTYAQRVDALDYDGVAAVFTEDGVLTVCMTIGEGRVDRERHGRAQIAEAMRVVKRHAMTAHTIGNHVATVDGDTATGETRCIAHHIGGEPGAFTDLVWILRYVDTYRRTAEGWRIAQRVLLLDAEAEGPWSGPAARTPAP